MEHSKNFPDCFYRVTVKGLCVRNGKLLLIRESKAMSGKWELPGGGLDFGEDIRTGFKREVEEEMGLKIKKISNSPVYVWTYKYENRRGLDWYCSFVVAYRIEFENLDFTPSRECEAVEFFSKEELQKLEFAGQAEKLPAIFDPNDFVNSF